MAASQVTDHANPSALGAAVTRSTQLRGGRRRSLPRVVIEPPHSGPVGALREFIAYRWCVPYFGRLYLQKRYQRTWLGFVWVPLKPAFNVASKVLIFGGVIGISTGRVPYTVFFLIATACWQLFLEVSLWATRSLEIGRLVLRKLEFPRLPMVFAAVAAGSVEFFVYVAFAAGALVYYVFRAHILYLTLGIQSLLVPAGLSLLILLGLGIGLLSAAAGARGRDVRYGLHFAFSFLYFATPVLYPLSKIPPHWRPLAELNPVTGALEMVKDGLFDSHELTLSASLVAVVGSVTLWVLGLVLLQRSVAKQRAIV